MRKSFLAVMAISLSFFIGVSVSSATNAPDFAAIAEQLTNGAPAAAPVVRDVDYSKAETNFMAYIAAISRSVDQQNIPFTKLAQQYIWGSDRMHKEEFDPLRAEMKARGANKPFIMVGGYWDTQISATSGGLLTLICYVSDPDGQDDIAGVELYYNQQPTGAFLMDNGQMGDFAAGDYVYGIQAQIAAPDLLPAGQYLLELVAYDHSGNQSDMWPYLTIN